MDRIKKKLIILIRCDSGVEVGFGHLSRCSVIAKEFLKKGNNIFFIIKSDEELKVKHFLENRDLKCDCEFISSKVSPDLDAEFTS
jgi:spore coat polysaccharide biosynthesis predicted glycosyltransferase SpsG